jgi:hypothetical protein
MDGSAQPQSVMALPVVDRITQLTSTAPPSIFTHAAASAEMSATTQTSHSDRMGGSTGKHPA